MYFSLTLFLFVLLAIFFTRRTRSKGGKSWMYFSLALFLFVLLANIFLLGEQGVKGGRVGCISL